MASSSTRIDFYYDVVSPYTWIAFEVLCRYKSRWNISLELKPFYLAGIMHLTGNRPPGMIPNKAFYMAVHDLRHLSKYFGVPLGNLGDIANVMFEKGSLSAQRLLTAVKEELPHKLEEVSRQLWLRIWSRDEDITLDDSLNEACAAAGISSDTTAQLILRIKDNSIKEKLKATTKEAFDLAAFGSPYIVAYVDGKPKPFFGSDRFEILADMIGEKWEGPLVSLKLLLTMPTSMATPVKLYYDVVSPFSWVAFEVLCRYQSKWNMALELKPFFLSGIMNLSDNRPPGMNPTKAAYMTTDLRRLRKYYDIPLMFPQNMASVMFNKGSLSAQRLLTAVKENQPDKLEELTRQLWLRIWSRDEDITLDDSLNEACAAAGIGSDTAAQLILSFKDNSVKEKLKATTQEAFDLGAFGSPFIVAYVGGKPEPFFGSDRFEILADMIGEKWEGPLVSLKAKY